MVVLLGFACLPGWPARHALRAAEPAHDNRHKQTYEEKRSTHGFGLTKRQIRHVLDAVQIELPRRLEPECKAGSRPRKPWEARFNVATREQRHDEGHQSAAP